MATVTFDHATRVYQGATKPAVDALNLDIQDGEFLVLVGPSGCGKSTSLRMLAGLEEVNGGAIRIGERDVTYLPPKDRDIAMVFQNYALYPHMTVADNMGFALKIAGVTKAEIAQRVQEAAKLLDLEAYLQRKPKALSGGQRQRVAMGRAIVRHPQVFLMDEPLSNLDAKLRVQTRTPDRGAAAPARHHHGLRHPRPGRGHDDGRPGRGPQGRPAPAGRHPAADVRPPEQRVRRRLHRLPADEPRRGRHRGRWRHVGNAKVEISRAAIDDAAREGAKTITSASVPRTSRSAADGIPVEVIVVEELGADAYVYGRSRRPMARRSTSSFAPTAGAHRPRARRSTSRSSPSRRTCSRPSPASASSPTTAPRGS